MLILFGGAAAALIARRKLARKPATAD